MTREEIEQLDDTKPYSFETDREEWWYNIGLKKGLKTADKHPKKGFWDADKVCDFLKNKCIFSAANSPVIVEFDGEELVRKLRKAMED